MSGSIPSNVMAWEGWAKSADSNAARDDSRAPGPALQFAAEYAEAMFFQEAMLPPLPTSQASKLPEPYSLPWYLDIEAQRHRREGRWIPRLLEFSKHSGETLLAMGPGLGTDWAQFAQHGAAVVVCSPQANQLALVRRNFELRGLTGRFLHAQPTSLPLESASVDVVCLASLEALGEVPGAIVDEAYRVLKPGGKVLAVARAKYDVDYWYDRCFPWQRWFGAAKGSESLTSARYSGRGLRRLFGRFIEHRIHKRHLRRSHVPHVWRWMPRSALERLMGRSLILKAFKPLSVALPVPMAA